jgi:hypothetical protein
MDFEATARDAFTLERLLARAADVNRELLGVQAAPPVTVVLDRQRVMGQIVAPGHEADARELAETFLGPRPQRPGSDGFDLVDANGLDLLGGFDSPENTPWRVVFMPRRDDVGLVQGLVYATAAALEGNGTVIADDVRWFDPPLEDPRQLIATTRLHSGPSGFREACTAYADQFR